MSEWGHDFRTSYLDIGRVLRHVTTDTRGRPPGLAALTGTASRAVLRDMLIELGIDRSDPAAIISPQTFDRPELTFDIVHADEEEIGSRLIGTLRSLAATFDATPAEFLRPRGPDSQCGIVFTQTVNPGRMRQEGALLKVQALLASKLGIEAGVYAGSKPKAWTGGPWNIVKSTFAKRFKDNEITVLVSTKAYGMGIDKPNIRYIVHVGVPGSIEAYYQEAGRAGRDRRDSRCIILHDYEDRGFHDFTHGKTYEGVEADSGEVDRLLGLVGDLSEPRTLFVPRSSQSGEKEERAIHRLLLLGVVRDYLVDWGGSRFELVLDTTTARSLDERLLAYVRRTQPGRVVAFEREIDHDTEANVRKRASSHARRLIGFIYDTVARSRQRALEEMVALAEESQDDDEIRDRILRYLELGQVAGELEELIDVAPFAFDTWLRLYGTLDTIDDAREWRGATARFLESAPDHPGLLAGRALAEAIVPEGDRAAFSTNLRAALRNALDRYSAGVDDVGAFGDWLVRWLHDRRPEWAALGYLAIENMSAGDHLAYLASAERDILADGKAGHADELAMIVTRRVERHERTLASLAKELVGGV